VCSTGQVQFCLRNGGNLMANDRNDRLYPSRPLVGVGAVVWDGQRVLLIRRDQPPAKGAWSVPGGLVELGESAEDAVRREVKEEAGIDVEVGPILGLFEPVEFDDDGRIRYHFIVIDFLAHYRSGVLRSGDDAAAARWVRPSDLAAYKLLSVTQEMIERALALVDD
jgi:8-oxo-dGTP diphosphatase